MIGISFYFTSLKILIFSFNLVFPPRPTPFYIHSISQLPSLSRLIFILLSHLFSFFSFIHSDDSCTPTLPPPHYHHHHSIGVSSEPLLPSPGGPSVAPSRVPLAFFSSLTRRREEEEPVRKRTEGGNSEKEKDRKEPEKNEKHAVHNSFHPPSYTSLLFFTLHQGISLYKTYNIPCNFPFCFSYSPYPFLPIS